MNKKGFTLVELSIVLVIIGLLIGGILAAQSMIKTAQLQSVVRRLQQYDIAIQNFRTKYDQIPGDAKSFGGNGDGVVDDGSNSVSTNGFIQFFTGEESNFFVHLQQGGFTPPDGTSFNPTAVKNQPFTTKGASINVPGFPELGDNVAMAIADTCTTGSCAATVVHNFGILSWQIRLGQLLMNSNNGIKPIDALVIDQKIDDGQPLTGDVTATESNAGTCFNGSNYSASGVALGSYDGCYTYIVIQSLKN